MQNKFTFKHMEALDSIEQYAANRIEKMDKYSLKKEMNVHFIFEAKRGLQKAEILIDAGKFHLSSEAEEGDLYSAIDKAVHRMEIQLVKNKEKVQEHFLTHRKEKIEMAKLVAGDIVLDESLDDLVDADSRKLY